MAAVAWVLKAPGAPGPDPQRGHGGHQPGRGRADRPRARRRCRGHAARLRSRILFDRGATDEFGIESIAALLASGPYRWQAHEAECFGVATNRVTFGAYRAPSSVPAAFAVESLIDELAGRLGHRPDRAAAAQRRRQGDRQRGGQPDPGVRRRELPGAHAGPSAVAAPRRARPRTKASGWRSAGGRAAMSPPPRRAGWTPTGA